MIIREFFRKVKLVAHIFKSRFNFTNFFPASAASGILTSNTNPFLKGDSGFISPACQSSNNHSASSEDSAENHDERENAGSMASNEDDERTLAKSPGKPSHCFSIFYLDFPFQLWFDRKKLNFLWIFCQITMVSWARERGLYGLQWGRRTNSRWAHSFYCFIPTVIWQKI